MAIFEQGQGQFFLKKDVIGNFYMRTRCYFRQSRRYLHTTWLWLDFQTSEITLNVRHLGKTDYKPDYGILTRAPNNAEAVASRREVFNSSECIDRPQYGHHTRGCKRTKIGLLSHLDMLLWRRRVWARASDYYKIKLPMISSIETKSTNQKWKFLSQQKSH